MIFEVGSKQDSVGSQSEEFNGNSRADRHFDITQYW